MQLICGADGCKGGWVVIYKDLDSGCIFWRHYEDKEAHKLFSSQPTPQIIALDIPIGLPEKGPRDCDIEARKRLEKGRASSVFPAPIRPVLHATSYREACDKRFEVEGKKMSRQAWAIVPKVRDIDELLRQDSELRARVREVHPEVSFYFLNNERPLPHGKKCKIGREERRKLLEPKFGQCLQAALKERRNLASTEDDVLDAFVALWTAERILYGRISNDPVCAAKRPFRVAHGDGGLRQQFAA